MTTSARLRGGVAAGMAASILITACSEPITQEEFEILSCPSGSIWVHETVNPNTGARGGVAATYRISYKRSGAVNGTILEINDSGALRREGEDDGFTILEAPVQPKQFAKQGHVFIDPRVVSASEYRELVACLEKGLPTAYDALRKKGIAVCAVGKECPGVDRQVPRLVTVRHRSLSSLRQQFSCPNGLSLTVSEYGMVRFNKAKSGPENGWMGSVVDGGKRMVFVSTANSKHSTDGAPLDEALLSQCTHGGAKSVSDVYRVEFLSADQALPLIAAARTHAQAIGLQPNEPIQPTPIGAADRKR